MTMNAFIHFTILQLLLLGVGIECADDGGERMRQAQIFWVFCVNILKVSINVNLWALALSSVGNSKCRV